MKLHQKEEPQVPKNGQLHLKETITHKKNKIVTTGAWLGAVGAVAVAGITWFLGTSHKNTHPTADIKDSQFVEEEFESEANEPPAKPAPLIEAEQIKPRELVLPPLNAVPASPIIAPVKVLPVQVINPPKKNLAATSPQKKSSLRQATKKTLWAEPQEVYEYVYDVHQGGPIIVGTPASIIEVSRSPRFSKLYVRCVTNMNGQCQVPAPPPGKIYWRVQGDREAFAITITPPPSTQLKIMHKGNIQLSDKVEWESKSLTNFFRVEVGSEKSMTSNVKLFSTNEKGFPVALVGAGQWFFRVGALNSLSGAWEYTNVESITVH